MLAQLLTLEILVRITPIHGLRIGTPPKKEGGEERIMRPGADGAIRPHIKWHSELQELIEGPDIPVNDWKSFVSEPFPNCSCSHVEGGCARGNSTIVTSVLSINKPHRTFEDYVKQLGSLLAKIPHTPVVAFVERGYEEHVIRSHPQGTFASTLCVVGLTANELPQRSFLKQYARALLNMPNRKGKLFEPEMTLPLYDIVQHSKIDLVQRAVLQNPFQSDRFAWLDGGLHPPMDTYFPNDGHIDILQCGDRVCAGFNHDFNTWLSAEQRAQFANNKYKIAWHCNNCGNGATWTGSRNAILRYSETYRQLIDQYLREGIMDDDQGPMLHLLLTKDDVIQDCRCKGYKFCTGFMLGHHKSANATHFQWE